MSEPKMQPIDAARLIFQEHRHKRQKRAYVEDFDLISFTRGWLRGRSKRK